MHPELFFDRLFFSGYPWLGILGYKTHKGSVMVAYARLSIKTTAPTSGKQIGTRA
jgi:hypothetical protein